MKRIFIPLMTIAVVAALLLGCMPAAPEAPPPAAPPPEAPPEETFTFVYHCPWPPKQILCDIEDLFLGNVEARTEGRVTFERIYGGTLGDLTVQPENIQ
ncbi:MAG: hypothetical protein JSW24_05455, partial [Dehalococcoidia bacterium]